MLYPLIRKILFQLEPEHAHSIALAALKTFLPFIHNEVQNCIVHTKVMGLEFPNKVGLAAGFDKNAEYIDVLASLGFGCIEIGTITPHPQPGNPKPRLFRLPKFQALINRMGFNNKGVDEVVKNIKRSNYKGILGVSIGKNRNTLLKNSGTISSHWFIHG